MAFNIKTWFDRIVERPNCRTLAPQTEIGENVYEVSRAEGAVSQEGTPLNAQTFNDLESRIAAAVAGLTPECDSVSGRGIYIKYPNGLMICYRAVIVTVPTSAFTNSIGTNRFRIDYNAGNALRDLKWTFPQPFYNTPVSVQIPWSGYLFTPSMESSTPTDATYRLIYEGAKPSTSPNPVLNTIAIGQWKDQIV